MRAIPADEFIAAVEARLDPERERLCPCGKREPIKDGLLCRECRRKVREVKRWTDDEDDILREYGHLGADELALRLSRSPTSVATRASKLGVSLKKAPTNAAGGAYCDEIEECARDLEHTPCGADPCELVSQRAKKKADLDERARDYSKAMSVAISAPVDDDRPAQPSRIHELERELLDTRLRLVAAIIDRDGVDVDTCADAQHEIMAARELLRRMAP